MKSKTVLSVLAAIIVLGFFLRVYGINYHSYGDEAIQIYYSLRLGTLKMLPVSFHRLALGVFFGLWYAAGRVRGVFSDPHQFINLYFDRQHLFYLAGRLFETLAGAACVPAIYSAGKKLYDERAGLLAALFLAVTPVQVVIAQKARGQALAALMALIALNWGIMIWKSGSRRFYLLAWAAAGAAASCTFYSLALALPLFAYHSLNSWDAAARHPRGRGRWGLFLRSVLGGKIAWGVVAGVLAYAVVSPGKMLEIGGYLRTTLVNTGLFGGSRLHYFGAEIENAWKFYLSRGFPEAFGYPLLAVCLFGLAFNAVRPAWKTSWPLIACSTIFVVVMGKGHIASPRYLNPLVPWLLLVGADALVRASDALGGKVMARRAVLAGAALAVAVPSGLKMLRYDTVQIGRNTKNLAEEWILDNLPPGTRIAVENMGYTGPDLKFTPVIDHWIYNLSDPELQALYRQRQKEGIDSFALKRFIDHPPAPKYYIRTISIKDEIGLEDLLEEGYQYVAINSLSWEAFRSPYNRKKYPEYTAKRLVFYDWLEREGELVQSFKPDGHTAGEEIRIYRLPASSPR